MRTIVSGLLAVAAATGCALPSQRVTGHGAQTTVHMKRYRLNGELVAVNNDTVWILTRRDSMLAPVARDSIVRLDVQRHRMTGGRTMGYMSIVGVSTAVLLTIACSSVEDTSCGAVLPGVMLPFVVLGSLFGLINSESAWLRSEPGEIMKARPYARFPQGIPDTIRTTPLRPR